MKFVALHDFRRRVIGIIVCLIVPIPLITRVHSVEVAWLACFILAFPVVCLFDKTDVVIEHFFIHTHRTRCFFS